MRAAVVLLLFLVGCAEADRLGPKEQAEFTCICPPQEAPDAGAPPACETPDAGGFFCPACPSPPACAPPCPEPDPGGSKEGVPGIRYSLAAGNCVFYSGWDAEVLDLVCEDYLPSDAHCELYGFDYPLILYHLPRCEVR